MTENSATSERTFQFVTTAQASLDARNAYSGRLKQFHLIGDTIVPVIGLGLLLAGYPAGFMIAPFGALLMALNYVEPLQRWLISRTTRSLLGQLTDVAVGSVGIRWSNAVASTHVPWSSLTSVLSNSRTVVFKRDRILIGYVPASVFASPADRAQFVRFARQQIAMTEKTS